MYAYSTGDAYTCEEIVAFEQYFLEKLGWSVKYPTFSLFSNLLSDKWDFFVKANFFNEKFRKLPLFRHSEPMETCMFQLLFRTIDIASFDYKSCEFDRVKFVAAAIYLCVGFCSGAIPKRFICENICSIVNDYSDLACFGSLNGVMDMFYNDCLGFSLNEIVIYVPTVCMFFSHCLYDNDRFKQKFDGNVFFCKNFFFF